MSVYFKEISDRNEINQCVELHKEIFDLNDIDAYPSSFFSMVVRREHPLGIIVGCFDDKDFIGLVVGISDSKIKSLYIPFAGLKKKYQNSRIGYKLILEIKKKAFQKGYKSIYGIFDPLESNLGKLYTSLGAIFNKYLMEPYQLINHNENIVDKMIFECLDDNHKQKNNNQVDRNSLLKYPIVDMVGKEYNKFLFEIPNNFTHIKSNYQETANRLRCSTRDIFKYYINERGYIISNCISGRLNNEKKTYYLFEKNELQNKQSNKSFY